jgi:hypothetical protein
MVRRVVVIMIILVGIVVIVFIVSSPSSPIFVVVLCLRPPFFPFVCQRRSSRRKQHTFNMTHPAVCLEVEVGQEVDRWRSRETPAVAVAMTRVTRTPMISRGFRIHSTPFVFGVCFFS